jgi:hypothetical protein
METLNEKIRNIIEEKVDAPFSTYGISGTSEAAKEIEKLIIQEKISYLKEAKDLLDRAYKFNNSDMGWDVDYETWKENYEQLTTELNKLNN